MIRAFIESSAQQAVSFPSRTSRCNTAAHLRPCLRDCPSRCQTPCAPSTRRALSCARSRSRVLTTVYGDVASRFTEVACLCLGYQRSCASRGLRTRVARGIESYGDIALTCDQPTSSLPRCPLWMVQCHLLGDDDDGRTLGVRGKGVCPCLCTSALPQGCHTPCTGSQTLRAGW